MDPNLFRSLILAVTLLSVAYAGPAGAQSEPVNAGDPDLSAHEWGTFTSVAGRDGQAVKWSPQSGSSDLPGFVEHYREVGFKGGLRGTVRMETPVLYFYTPRETTVSVKVSLSKGLITEWYPRASRVEPIEVHDDAALYQLRHDGSIGWNSVTVVPGLAANFPHDVHGNHYYAARETSAAPLVVKTSAGNQQEKFLFYRGVSTFSVPMSAMPTGNGKLLVRNLGEEEIPSVILFERRGEKLGYRLGGGLQNEMLLDPPELTATPESMSRDLEEVLVRQGLYPDEAHAMVETWQGSWFEEGSRLFYIVPPHFVNTILPLTIRPAPSQTVRVFVGRMELVTPATKRAVAEALTAHDRRGLEKYGRFLEPILDEMRAENPARSRQLNRDLALTY